MTEKKKTQNIHQKLKEAEKLQAEYLAGWQRAKADFLNYKKSETERNNENRQYFEKNCLLGFLPIYQNLKLANAHINDQGLAQVLEQFKETLESFEVKEIGEIGEQFNPELHEAIEQVESEKESGAIIEVITKGYTYQNKLLIPAKVKVSANKKSNSF